MRNGAPVYLKDVAKASDTHPGRADEHALLGARISRVPTATVVLAVFRQAGANAVAVAKRSATSGRSSRSNLPPSVTMTPIYDRSLVHRQFRDGRAETLVIAFVLVVLVIFVFLGRAADTLIPSWRCRCRC